MSRPSGLPHALVGRARGALRARGFDVVRFPVEGSLWALLDRIFRSARVGCVLDVGAHVGEFGGFLRGHGYRGDIISFEPVPVSQGVLEVRAAGDPRWHVHPYALGATNGSRTMLVAHAANLSSFLEPTTAGRTRFAGAIEVHERRDVEIRRLDSVFAEVTAPAAEGAVFLKCDTQRLDLEVVEGAGTVLDRLAGLQLELDVDPLYHGSALLQEGLDLLAARGFRIAGMFPVARDDRARLLQVEAVFVRAAP